MPTIEKDKPALETAKGCTKPPHQLRSAHTGTLYSFLKLYELGERAGCFSSWIQDGVDWAQDVVEQNPNSFPSGWSPFQKRVDAAKSRYSVDDASYRRNPTSGSPRNVDQALSYLIYQAGDIWIRQFEENESRKGEAAKAWLATFSNIAPDFRHNPTIEGLQSRGFDFAAKRYEDWYINGNLPG